MKRLLAATALSVSMATSSFAGGIVQIPAPVIIEDTAASNQGIFVPVFTLILLLLVLHQDGGATDVVSVVSDERLKTDITQVGMTEDGIGIYQWRYIWDDQMYQGVLAQDVLQHRPDAVHDIGGVFTVDYDALGLEMIAID